MAAGGDGVARQAELRRIEGNVCFKKARLGAAIDCYTEAIALCPDVAVYWMNRALCHFKLKEWAKVEEDSRKALALDHTLVKGHYLLGCALLEKEESALAIKEFEKGRLLTGAMIALAIGGGAYVSTADEGKFCGLLFKSTELVNPLFALLDAEFAHSLAVKAATHEFVPREKRPDPPVLGRTMTPYAVRHRRGEQRRRALILLKSANSTDEMAEEIWQVLAKAKYLDWEKHSTERLWRMQSLKEACESALQEHHFLTGTLEEDSNGSSNEYSEQFKLLSEVFSQATIADTPADVPDYLCCQITFEIFRDPVITPSGVTYERATLVEHLHKVGNFDPVTREPLKEHQLVPNLAIKEAVQAYLKEHSWAYKLN